MPIEEINAYDLGWLLGVVGVLPLVWIGGLVALAAYFCGVLMVLSAVLSAKGGPGSVGYVETDH